jgi:hypothetical protein
MPRTLIVPGVSVEARFDVPPPLPARSGILGAIGVVDRLPDDRPVGVTTTQELFDLFGPATRLAFPEVVSALVNGVSEVIVSPVNPASGAVASLVLRDDENQDAVELRARAVGPWGNQLSARVIRTLAQDRRTVRRVSIEILHTGRSVERHDNLVLRPGDANDLFTVINRDSSAVVAVDPTFQLDLPAADADAVAFQDGPAAAATLVLRGAGNADLIRLTARVAGEGGNRISAQVMDGRAALTLNGAGGAASVRVRAVSAGAAGAGVTLQVADGGDGTITVTVRAAGAPDRAYPGLNGVAAVVAALNSDPDVRAERLGDVPPTAAPATALVGTRTLTIRVEGQRTTDYADLASAQAIVDAVNAAVGGDADVTATLLGAAATLPEVSAGNAAYLAGGRDAGPRRRYRGRDNPGVDVLELRPADGVAPGPVRLRISNGATPGTVRLTVSLEIDGGVIERERHDDLTMDPDSPRYLVGVLGVESTLVRAIGLHPSANQGVTRWPAANFAPRSFSGGRMPGIAAWQAAIDALGNEDSVDLMLAGLQDWQDADLSGITVQQAMLGHARAQTDNAKPRIVLGSVRPEASRDPDAIIAHRTEVTDRRFVLTTPAGTEGALAGLLGHLQYFVSPTFKTIAQPGAPLTPYSESVLNKLVGPDGNLCVISERKGRGVICIKGIATDGFQISVVRVADRCIREVNAIANRFIGELNNAEQRTALEQMIKATFTQMERDGALVPSVDGKSPAFEVSVYASQNDTAAGIVRVDIAVRPVRAIDYIYATIRVKN